MPVARGKTPAKVGMDVLEERYMNLHGQLQNLMDKFDVMQDILVSLDKKVDLMEQEMRNHIDSNAVWKDRHEKYHQDRAKEIAKRNWALWILVITTCISAVGGGIALLVTHLGGK